MKQLLAVASPKRAGDELAGVAAASEKERVAARYALSDVPLADFLTDSFSPYESDEVTRLILDTHSKDAFRTISSLSVGELRDWLLSSETTSEHLAEIRLGLTPEMAAAVCKIMRNQDLIAASRKCLVTTAFRSTIGLRGRLATRLQPNHPTDDLRGIAAAIVDGLMYGVGDAVIGVNPATDNVENCVTILQMLDAFRTHLDIPTQTCVLTHVTNALAAMELGAPTDLIFQSVAGTEAANAGFGVSLAILQEAFEAAHSQKRGVIGSNVMYFETGQGSALSANAHCGMDQQTAEARAYAVARKFEPLLVNTVVGFIGPEYLLNGKEIARAGLEDHFCGKLLGLPMGCDVCYTNHAYADQDDMDSLATLLTVAGSSFLIAVPGSDDIMLNYQSLSFHDILYLRDVLGVTPAPEFDVWMREAPVRERFAQLTGKPNAVLMDFVG